MKIDFERPPINEVSIGMQFAPLINFRSEHVGLFWSGLRADFPQTQQVPPIGNVAALGDIFPIPRFWFISKDDATLVQIQKGGFWFNWRLRGEEYPRFENVFKSFQRYRNDFVRFLTENLLAARLDQVRYQLTYTNLFEQVPYWSNPDDTKKIVPAFNFLTPGIENAKVKDFNSVTISQISEDLSLGISVRNGTNNATKRPVFVIELDAFGSHPYFELNTADGWYDRAHSIIVESFVSLTNTEIQKKYWIAK